MIHVQVHHLFTPVTVHGTDKVSSVSDPVPPGLSVIQYQLLLQIYLVVSLLSMYIQLVFVHLFPSAFCFVLH